MGENFIGIIIDGKITFCGQEIRSKMLCTESEIEERFLRSAAAICAAAPVEMTGLP
jgi:hypothetical protein